MPPARTTLLASLALLALAAPLGAQADADATTPRGFSIYDTPAAKGLWDEAQEHAAAGRWIQAIASLQRLIEQHRGEVLGATRPPVLRVQAGTPTERISQQDVHPGASSSATRRLFALPAEARAIYRERYAGHAAAALRRAIEGGDRGGLAAVARRWPLTEEARRAWWSLGDLEVERGNIEDGLRAWARALGHSWGEPELALEGAEAWLEARRKLEQEGAPEGVRRRADFALQVVESELEPATRLLGGGAGDASALDPGTRPRDVLGRAPDAWPDYFALPTHPFTGAREHYPLFATRWMETVFVSTSLEVVAVGAFTGRQLWASGERPSWRQLHDRARQEFLDHVDPKESLIAPVAGQGVVVAALQIPLAYEGTFDYGDMEIIRQIPNRRLFAFDTASGELLWDTEPPPDWDGETGSFSDRMRIVGPPVLSGTRVLVPAARLRGRIEYHVGCYDLHSGELLWSTALVTGQRELNMFGRMGKDFSAPPLRVVGNRVVAQTQLGVLACLDLFSGDIEWEVLYDQIKIPKNTGYNMQDLRPVWRNVPPAIVGGTILATPFDSEDLIAVDLGSGALAWSLRIDGVRAKAAGTHVDLLVGADERRIYLGGRRIVALEAALGGLGAGPPGRLAWRYPAGEGSGEDLRASEPRPVVDGDRLWVPRQSALEIVDLATGRSRGLVDWAHGTSGNPLVCDGMLFSVGKLRLEGYFEWERLLERAKSDLEARPGDAGAALTYATLLLNRGTAERQQGRSQDARRHLHEARRTLLAVAPGDGVAAAEPTPGLARALHEVLREEARALRDLPGQVEQALALLAEARELAPTREELRDTLLEEQALLSGRDGARWLAVLDRLIAECADMRLYYDGRLEPDAGEPWSRRLQPVVGTAERPGSERRDLPVGLWALLQRAELEEPLRTRAETFADLHALLERYGAWKLPEGDPAAWASARIGALLASGRAGYEPFEERATRLYESALAAEDGARLERVVELYPHSRAAALANDARLEQAARSGDPELVAAIVQAELPADWRPRDASEHQLRRLLRLGRAMAEAGNRELEQGLVRSLARDHGDFVSDLAAHEGRSLAELAETEGLGAAQPAAPAPTPTFRADARIRAEFAGGFLPLGELPPGEGGLAGRVLALAAGEELIAFSESAPETHLWNRFLGARESPRDWKRRALPATGGLLLASYTRLVRLDRDTGDEVWSWYAEDGQVESLAADSGVAVVLVGSRGAPTGEFLAAGIDVVTGAELWRLRVDGERYEMRAVAGDGRLAFLPNAASARGVSFDLFTGKHLAALRVGERLPDSSVEHAWIEGGRLIVPRFLESHRPETNHVIAVELDTGLEAWRVDIGGGVSGGRELESIAAHGGRTWLVLREGQSRGSRWPGAVHELATQAGAIEAAPVVRLGVDDYTIGVESLAREELAAPWLFLRHGPRANGRFSMRAVHLPYGARWESELPFSSEEYTGRMPLPAVSEEAVAVAWRALDRGQQNRYQSEMLFVSRDSGLSRGVRALRPSFDGNAGVRFATLGDALFVCGAKMMEILR